MDKEEIKIIEYLNKTCLLGGGQKLYNIVNYCLGLDFDYECDRKKTSKLLQQLKRKGYVSYESSTKVWYLKKISHINYFESK